MIETYNFKTTGISQFSEKQICRDSLDATAFYGKNPSLELYQAQLNLLNVDTLAYGIMLLLLDSTSTVYLFLAPCGVEEFCSSFLLADPGFAMQATFPNCSETVPTTLFLEFLKTA